ncbi:hypothetical protein HDA40_002570 [Hamadaea flava]|uniref:Uncharacterized protein n=1 Tax=Hamadaea flava TaxID=1742688 RepID=A0ABV8LMR1_9ACTN|nr:hypothetical protein [Hamadaea flava]MCP2324063.1 hypothetical protein [Hamadaea flava]
MSQSRQPSRHSAQATASHQNRATKALDPAETTRILPVCLLDCEPGVRRIAAQHAPLTDDAVKWLTELAGDPIEEPGVRDVAAARLATR